MATRKKTEKAPAETVPPVVDPAPANPDAPELPPGSPPLETPTDDAGGATPETPAEAAPAKRGRGRPPGSGSKASAEKSPGKKTRDVADLARQIQGIHRVAALATGLPLLEIADQEAAMLASGISAVAEEYGFALSGKTGAALQLFAAMGFVYGPRVIAVKRMRDEMRAAQAAANANADAAPGTALMDPATLSAGADGSATPTGN